MTRTTKISSSVRPSRKSLPSEGEVLSIAEIERRYKDEWILLADPIEGKNFELKGGTVAFHSKDRDQVYKKAIELKLKYAATHYTGQIPEDMAVIL